MNDSIGARLREAREKRRLTLAQVSETTKIRAPYLQALESDDLSAMPSTAQARGFMRLYAEFLGVDLAELIPPAASPAPTAGPQASAEVSTVASSDNVKRTTPSLLRELRDRVMRRLSRNPKTTVTSTDGDSSPETAAEGEPLPPNLQDQTVPDKKKALSRS